MKHAASISSQDQRKVQCISKDAHILGDIYTLGAEISSFTVREHAVPYIQCVYVCMHCILLATYIYTDSHERNIRRVTASNCPLVCNACTFATELYITYKYTGTLFFTLDTSFKLNYLACLNFILAV